MTRLVVLAPAAVTSVFDEIAIFATALTPSAMADLFAGGPVDFTSDPEELAGWEEVYGNDFPLAANDVPVLQNGLCRVRWSGTFFAFVVDAFVDEIGWQEVGRVTVFHDASSGSVYTQQGQLQSAEVVEYTWERGVIGLVTSVTVADVVYRMETYVSLQRGWTGPRFECYPNPVAGDKLGARIVLTPNFAAWTPFQSGEVTVEPWAAAVGGIKTLALTWLRAETYATIADTSAYGVSRTAMAISAAQGSAIEGYVSARLGLCSRGVYSSADGLPVFGTATVVIE